MRTILTALAVAMLVPLGGATHPDSVGACDDWHDSTVVAIPPEPAPGVLYVIHDASFLNGHDFMFSVWIYQESNGVAGLQRDDGFCYTPGFDTTTADTIIF